MKKIAMLTTVSLAAFAGTPKTTKTETPAETTATETPATDDATKAKAERVAPILAAVRTDVAMPEVKSKRGSKSAYDFDSLSVVGASFAIMNKTAKEMQATVNNANRRSMKKKTDEAGNIVFKTNDVKDANGVVVGKTPTTEPEMVPDRVYFVVDCDATDPDGAKSRVFRRQ